MEKKNITAGALSRHNWDTRCRNAIINAHVHSLPKKRYARKKIPYFIQINGDCHINRGIQLGDFSPTASRAVSNNKNLVTLIHSLTQLVKQFLGKKKKVQETHSSVGCLAISFFSKLKNFKTQHQQKLSREH